MGNYREETQAYYLARSGLNAAVAKLMENISGKKGDRGRWVPDGRPYRVSLDKGFFEVRVADESGKVDLNKAQRSDLSRLLTALEIDGAERDTIVDSTLDWLDENDFHRLNGAEDAFYGSLPEPYGAKDGPMDTVDELLWVKGVMEEFFYGEEDTGDEPPRAGLEGVFTVHTGSVRVNVNTAPFEVLLALPGIDGTKAGRIIEARENAEFQSAAELARIGVTLGPTLTKYIGFTSSGIYTIEATGGLEGSPVRHTVRAVMEIRKTGQRVIYWKDQARVRRSSS